jgi:hypothetical protein
MFEETKKRVKMVRGSKYNQTKEWLEKHDHNIHGRYTANINTHTYHDHHCQDIHKMNPVHKITTNNEMGLYRPCSHCKPHIKQYQIQLEQIIHA